MTTEGDITSGGLDETNNFFESDNGDKIVDMGLKFSHSFIDPATKIQFIIAKDCKGNEHHIAVNRTEVIDRELAKLSQIFAPRFKWNK